MQDEGAVQVFGFADIVLDVSAVISDRAVDIRSAAHQETQFAAEAVADRADLAVALRQLCQKALPLHREGAR